MTVSVETVDHGSVVTMDPRRLAEAWLGAFGAALESGDAVAAAGQFVGDGWLRDRLALTWDLRTFHGREAIATALSDRLAGAAFSNLHLDEALEPALVDEIGVPNWVEASFTFSTRIGRGRGFVRLIEAERPDPPQVLAWTVVLDLRELTGHEEPRGRLRPAGVIHDAVPGTGTWLDRRQAAQAYLDHDPAVLVLGAGQNGLAVAARLGQLGVSTLVLERHPRIGDNWRNRYHSLVLHDPVVVNHLPYMDFPETWPRFIPKDKLAGWLEAYAEAMELNVWTGASIDACRYDDSNESWTVEVTSSGSGQRELHPRHLVFATGHSGLPYSPDIDGAHDFKGELVHSSQYTSGAGRQGDRILVVGAGNSGHDICHDLSRYGAEVTMLQRSATYVMGSTNGISVLLSGLYERGLSLEDADHLANSLPLRVGFDLQAKLAMPAIAELDAKMLRSLRETGYQTNDATGIFELYATRGGGYYVDVGATAAIIEGRIKVRSGVEIDRFTETGAVFSDGTAADFDAVILATGFGNMREVARAVVGDAIADQCSLVWGVNDEGEMNSVWGPSGHDRLWFMAGNLVQVRHFSLTLALQIKASEEGLLDRYERRSVSA